MIKRILAHIQRLSRARRFRVPFYRRANFRIPSIVRIHDRTVTVASPGEHGAASDFVTCFIDDEYGLGELNDPIATSGGSWRVRSGFIRQAVFAGDAYNY
jgi:hypothetical protein